MASNTTTTTDTTSQDYRVFNFCAGPSTLPLPVLKQARDEFFNYKGTGMSVMELSHRSKVFDEIIETAESNLRTLLSIPSNYRILFFQGGGMGQFAATYLNLQASKYAHEKRAKLGKELVCDYLVTGSWSEGAVKECKRLGGNANLVIDTKDSKYSHIPDKSTWKLSPPEETAYVYYCDNETIHGVEFDPDAVTSIVDPSVPIICDISSNILSRPIDISKFGVLVAGAQKNMGPAGATLVIVRDDLLERPQDVVPKAVSQLPTVFDYALFAKAKSLLNTPSTYTIYMCGLVYKWVIDQGGVEGMQRLREKRSGILYDVIDKYPDFYHGFVAKQNRSSMNPVFTLPNEELSAQFLKESQELGMVQMKGHRSLGGIRPSLYNALPVEAVEHLVKFMEEFYQKHK
ncbi:Phosphoserine transaminase [Mycoemilia scoparia]|uniref:Phosphoserine aminotransferase n=1 Tax=Mycoemilia scoparia TaxID=417184 RepID=A0A9W8DMM3_9FUNG|nr:Phosphoserine transaminase [Mycoemilia scoparia]